MNKQLEIGIKIESEHKETVSFIREYFKQHGSIPPAKMIYEHIAKNHLKEFPDEYYSELIKMENKLKGKPMKKAFLKIHDALFLAIENMDKARGPKADHKYYKRIPNPKGKGWIYFYNIDEWKQYQKNNTLPVSGILSGILNFFKFNNESEAKQKIKDDYQQGEVKTKFGITVSDWINHVSEYFNHKQKWDLFFQKKQNEQKQNEKNAKNAKNATYNDKKIKSESKKIGFNSKVMYYIYTYYKEDNTNGRNQNRTGQGKLSANTQAIQKSGIDRYSLPNVQERKPADNKSQSGIASGMSGNRPGRDVRLTKGQIKATRKEILDLLASKTDDEMTAEDKELLRQYEGAGGLDEQDKSVSGTLYEYYTPRNVINKIWQLVNKYIGPGSKDVLEPSAGIGRFAENQNHNFTMLEIDPVSARINKILFPDANISNKPFQELFMKGNIPVKNYTGKKFDIVVGNPPYGAYAGLHKGLGEGKEHTTYQEYFIDRGLDTLKDGGIMAFIVPSTFLRDNQYSTAKSQIASKGKLLEAYRLPNGTFSTTGVGTDIIILRKEKGNINDFLDDKYFQNNPNHILGDATTRTGRFGKPEQYVSLKPGDTFDSVISSIDTLAVPVVPVNGHNIDAETKAKISMALKDNKNAEKLTHKEKKQTEKKDKKNISIQEKESEPVQSGPKETDTLAQFNSKYNKHYNETELNIWKNTGYSGIIDTGKLSKKEMDYLKQNENICIDEGNNFVHKVNYASGNIYQKLRNLEAIKDKLSPDKYESQKKLLESVLPEFKTVKNFFVSPISDFAKHYLFDTDKEIDTSAELPENSLIKKFFQWATGSSYNFYRQNWGGGVTEHDLPSGLEWSDIIDYVFQKPVSTSRRGDSSNNKFIKEKKQELRRDVTEKLFKRFIETGLNKAEQTQLEKDYNEKFNSYVAPDYSKIPLFVDGISKTFKGKQLVIKEKQMQGASFLCNKGNGLLAHDVGVGKTMTGIVATVNQLQTGRAKRPVICVPKAVYSNWIKEIKDMFPDIKINELGNLGKDYVNSNLAIAPGTLSVMTYQALQKLTFKDETIHGDLIEDMLDSQQWEKEKMSDRDRAQMKQKIYEKLGMAIATNSAVVDRNNFDTMPDDEDADKPEEIDDEEEVIEGASHYLEDLGFDHITVDETHNFKNVFGAVKTAMKKGEKGKNKRVANEFKNLAGGQSLRALKMFAVTQVIQKNNNDRNVFALTATPFTNSPIEIYNILSLVARKKLKELNIYNLHEFMAQFAKLKSEWAVKANGNVERKSVMKEFQNLSALQNLIREYIDKVDGEEAGVVRPVKHTHLVDLNMTRTQKKIYEIEQKRFDLRDDSGRPVPGATLKAINNMRMATISPSLVEFDELYDGSGIPELVKEEHFINDSPKLKFTFDSVSDFYKQQKQMGQVVYMPRGVKSFSTAVNYLVQQGIPKKAIATISGKTSNDAKEKIMQSFNDPDGEIKIVIGSDTIKEGVNLNGNSAVLYNIMLGWNPFETTQVEGRIWRQGNKQGYTHIVYPQLIDSVDSAMYQKHDEKRQRFEAIWSYKGDALNVEDINPEELKFELIKDPVRRAKFQMDLKLEAIEDAKRDKRIFIDMLTKFKNDFDSFDHDIKYNIGKIPQYEKDVKKAENDLEKAENNIKEYKAKTSKKEPDYQYKINDLEREVRWAKDKVASEKKYLREAISDIKKNELEKTGIQEKLNGMGGLNIEKITDRIAIENKEIKKLVDEEHDIKNNKERYIKQAEEELKRNKKEAAPVNQTVDEHVKLLLGNLKSMEAVKPELDEITKKTGRKVFNKVFNPKTKKFDYYALQ